MTNTVVTNDGFHKFIEKIDKYCEKTNKYISKLYEASSIWYVQDLSETYFDVIANDIFLMIKKLVGVCIFVDIRNELMPCRNIEELIPWCPRDCEESMSGDGVYKKYLFTQPYKVRYNILGCPDCRDDTYHFPGIDLCFKCDKRKRPVIVGQEEKEFTKKIMCYCCGSCKVSFFMSNDDYYEDSNGLGNILLKKGVFIEKIYGRYINEIVNDYLYNESHDIKIRCIKTDRGEYTLSKKY